jgi:osmotically inducible protein OsmC
MPTRKASAVWEGSLREGKGTFTGESGAIAGDYSFGSRFGDKGGTNPEELLAAAEAACFSMALSVALEQAGFPPERVETHAACTIDKVADAFAITTMRLTCVARVPGFDRDTFKDLAEATKAGCPISKALLGNVEIELDARLED